jgi:hypothetical protein
MRFSPRQTVALHTSDGTEIKARAFYYTSGADLGLQVEFYSEDGTPIRCVDKERGVYTLGEPPTMLIFESRAHMRPTIN